MGTELPTWLTTPSVTDWLQAAGAFLAVPVAVWSSLTANKARKTSDKIERDGREAASYLAEATNDYTREVRAKRGEVVWQVTRGSGDSFDFTNLGDVNAELIDVTEVTESARGTRNMMVPDGYIGTEISPGNSFKVIVVWTLATPLVVKVRVKWKEGQRTVEQTYAVAR